MLTVVAQVTWLLPDLPSLAPLPAVPREQQPSVLVFPVLSHLSLLTDRTLQ